MQKRIAEGILRFQKQEFPKRQDLFQELALGQKPTVLMVTCADSRIDPCLLTQTQPGELFISRNAGNIVPAYGSVMGGETATIEYAVEVLKVSDIVVCGHSDCGAMKGLRNLEKLAELPAVTGWLAHAESARRTLLRQYSDLDEKDQIRVLTEENVLCQLNNLRTHPAVAAAMSAGKLNLYGWVYYIESGSIEAFDPEQGRFVAIGASAEVPEASPRLRRNIGAVA